MCIRDRIIGAVVDADFSQAETLPALLNALEVDYEVNGKRKTLVLEVQQHRSRIHISWKSSRNP